MPISTTLQQFFADRVGVDVVAHRTQGRSLARGKLAQMPTTGSSPSLVLANNDASQTIPFGELRYAFFPAGAPVDPSQPRQHIDLSLADGGRLQGEAHQVLAMPEADLVQEFGPVGARLDVLIPKAATTNITTDTELNPRTLEELEQALQKTTTRPSIQLGQALIERGLINPKQLEDALAVQAKEGGRLGSILVDQGAVKANAIAPFLRMQQGILEIRLDRFQPQAKALKRLPQNVALANQALPLMLFQGRLVVAMLEPLNEKLLHSLRLASRMELLPLHSNEPRLAALIRRYYEPIETQPILDEAPPDEERAAIALVESIINEAIQLHASDIHFQPTRQDLQVRYRIDGVLEERASHPRSLLAGVVGRMKVLGQLDIAEHRVPQDGGHRWTYEGHKVDLRISIMPTVYGESIVIRILDAMIGMRRLDDIGFRKEDEDRLRDLLQRRDGLILVTGPTGSGKSTTLYAALATLNQEELNIMTVENPVEYHLSGIKQIEVNPTAGYDFARALRSILRHDPDVILIGEIRDHETLQIALESALTGHLVLSTLHTNNAASTLARLLEMGAPDYLIRDTLRGVLAQRLVRLNCTHCLEPESITVELRSRLKLDSSFHSKHGTGCDHCRNTGYSGRTAVYELLEVTDSIYDQLTSGVSSIKIESQAIEEGMTTLRENALYLVEQGLTSLSELQRAGLI